MNRRSLDWLAVAVTFAWAAFVFAALYVVQKPFGLSSALRLASLGSDLAVAAIIVTGAAGVGLRLLAWAEPAGMSAGERLALGTLLGLGGVSLLWLVLGSAGLLQVPVALVVTGVLVGASLGPLRAWRRTAVGQIANLSCDGTFVQRPPALLGIYLGLLGALSLVRTLLPPTAWDGLFYHLFGPQQWTSTGRLATWQDFPHLHYPRLVEMLFLPALLLRDDIAATLLHWVFLPLVLWSVWAITRRHLPGTSPWVAVAVAASLPMLPLLASWPYTDVALAAFQMTTMLALLRWREQHDRRWLIVAGALSGFAMGVKYTSFVLPLTGALLLILWERRHPSRIAVSLLRFGLTAAIVAAPWYLRTWVETGNPVYPFVFGGKGWDEFRAAWYTNPGTGVGWNPVELLKVPLLATLGIRDANYYDGRTGPLFLALTPLALWVWLRNVVGPAGRSSNTTARAELDTVGALLLAAGVQGAVWMFGVVNSAALWQSRFLLTMLLLLAPVLAWSLGRLTALDTPRFSVSGLLRLLVGVALTFNALDFTLDTAGANPLPWLFGFESRTAFLAGRLGSHAAAMQALEGLPPASRVLFLWEPRAYLAPRPAQPDAILDEFAHRRWRHDGDGRAVAVEMRSQGYTHLLIYWAGARFAAEHLSSLVGPTDVAALEAFVAAEGREVWRASDGSYAIYELKEP